MTAQRCLLVSAYGCEPGKGSEQGVGWNWVLQLARLAQLVVVTRANNRDAIERGLPPELADRIRFVYYDLPERLRVFKRRERGLYLYYLLWQWGAYRAMRREIAENPVNYAIHLTFGSVWMPTFMHWLPVPFIWGPVGGGEAVPWKLIRSLPLRARVTQYARYLLIATVSVNPLIAGVARRAQIILARTNDTAKMFPARRASKVRVVLETAASDDWFDRGCRSNPAPDSGRPLEVIYTGRLVALKNLDMAVRAVALASHRGAKIQFTIVGDGPMQSALEQRAVAEGIADNVIFTGRCTQDEVLERLEKSDVYLFPSLKEGGVWSLMEAMAIGLPTVCVNTSGMAVIADRSCARLIDPGPQDAMIDAFAKALCDLAAAPDLRHAMGAKARQRLENEFRWAQKGDLMADLFENLERAAT